MAKDKPLVFISYSHDSDEHLERVRRLDASLVRDGFDCRLDIYKKPGDGWPRWMTRQIKAADFILCVVTEKYLKRFDDEEKHERSHGVVWEATLIQNLLYKKNLKNKHIFPVMFHTDHSEYIPLELEGQNHIILEEQEGYNELIRIITDQPLYQRDSEPGDIPDLPPQKVAPLFGEPKQSKSQSTTKDSPDFSSQNDDELRKTCQERQLPKMIKELDNKNNVINVLSSFIQILGNNKKTISDVKAVVEAFLALTDEQASEAAIESFIKLCRDKNLDDAMVIGNFVEKWLPVIFQHHGHISRIRTELSQSSVTVVKAPNELPILSEVLMAEVDEGLIKLELSARNELVSRFDLGGFCELGLDEEGKEYQKQFYELLECRFGNATDTNVFEGTLHKLVKTICEKHDNTGELRLADNREQLQEKVAGILTDLYRFLGRRYFCCVDIEDNFSQGIFENLKEQYPTLVFLVNNCTDAKAEAKRYRTLSRIIATAKGDTTLYEEIISVC